MADHENDRRRRRFIRHTACFNTIENATLIPKVNAAGISISSFLRLSALDFSATRAVRTPTVNHRLAVQLLAEMGQLTTAFDRAADRATDIDAALIETAMRDVSEMRLVLLESMGRAP
jgi:hypothetical protein